jgi:hypothetical protein
MLLSCFRRATEQSLESSNIRILSQDEAAPAYFAKVEHTQSEQTAADDGEPEERASFLRNISRCTDWVKNPASTWNSSRASEDV